MADAFVIFEAAGVRYAAPVGQVREVMPWTPPTPLPGAPDGVLGVIKARGATLPVLTVPDRGLTTASSAEPPDPLGRRLLLAEVGGRTVALAADAVVTVARVAPTADDAVPASATGSDTAVTALIEIGDRPTLAVDLDTLLAPASAALPASA